MLQAWLAKYTNVHVHIFITKIIVNLIDIIFLVLFFLLFSVLFFLNMYIDSVLFVKTDVYIYA